MLNFKAYFALLLAALIYGGNVVAGRLIAGTIPPLTLSALRAVLALAILLPIAWPAMKRAQKPNRKELLQLIVISIVGITIPYISLMLGLQDTSGTNASVIFATLPAMTNSMLFFICKTKPSKFQIWGMVTSFLGLIIVFTHGDMLHLLSFKLGKGELFLFINVFSISIFNIIGQNMMRKFSSIVTSVYSIIFATLTLIPMGFWQLNSFAWHLSWSGWLIVLYMGFMSAGIAFFLNLYGIDKIGSGQASIFNNMQHVFSISLSVLILKEALAAYHWFGFLLVISGVVLSLTKSSAPSPQLATRKRSNQTP